MQIVFTGSRKLRKREVYEILSKYKFDRLIVGDCPKGGDLHARTYAHHNNIKIKPFRAYWKIYGNSAGILRNEEMVKYAATIKDIYGVAIKKGESKGTSNCISNFLYHNISYKVYVIDEKEKEDV